MNRIEDPRSDQELYDVCRSCGCSFSDAEPGTTVEVENQFTGGAMYVALCEVCADGFYESQRERDFPDGGPA